MGVFFIGWGYPDVVFAGIPTEFDFVIRRLPENENRCLGVCEATVRVGFALSESEILECTRAELIYSELSN